MNGAYPTTADSLAEWLEAINLGKYLPNLEKAGVKPEELPELTEDTLQAAGVGIVGHRRRMVTAAQTLMPPTPKDAATDRHVEGAIVSAAAREGEARPQPSTHVQPGQLLSIKEAIEAKEQMRYNSTSSVYISSTISKPDTEEITFCVAVVIHDRIMQGEVQPAEVRSRFYYFSEDNNPLYAEPVPSSDDALAKKPKREVPSEETIYHTIHSIHDCAGFSSECLIVCLIYMERITSTSAVPILVTTWRPILLAALIIAQKVWDDRSLHNADFSVFCPMFTLKEINHLEKKFLELISYEVSVSASLYTSYYFQLRTLCQRAQRDFKMKPIDSEVAAALESRSTATQKQMKGLADDKKSAAKKYQSANDIDTSSFLSSSGTTFAKG